MNKTTSLRRYLRWCWYEGCIRDGKGSLLFTPFGCSLMLLLGAPILVTSLVFFARTEIFLHRSLSTSGTVIRMVLEHGSSENSTIYAPVFRFSAQDGRTYTIASNNYTSPPEFTVGETVKVRYEKDRPEDARIGSHWQIYATEEIAAAIGLFFSGIGLFSMGYQRRRAKRNTNSLAAY